MAHRHLAAVAAAMQAPAVRSVLRSIDFGLRLRGCKQQPVFNSGLPAGGRRAHSNVSARPDPPSQDDEKAVWYSEVHLKVLGLSQGATKRDIKQAYLKLVKELHPDRSHHQRTVRQDEAGKAAAQAEFIAVQEAFSKLMGRKEQVNTGSGFHSHTDRNPYTEHHPVWTYMGGSIGTLPGKRVAMTTEFTGRRNESRVAGGGIRGYLTALLSTSNCYGFKRGEGTHSSSLYSRSHSLSLGLAEEHKTGKNVCRRL
eukprot:2660376-Rhodomonas_salina.1